MEEFRRNLDDTKINFIQQMENVKTPTKSGTPVASFVNNPNEEMSRLVHEVQKMRHIIDDKFSNLMNLLD